MESARSAPKTSAQGATKVQRKPSTGNVARLYTLRALFFVAFAMFVGAALYLMAMVFLWLQMAGWL
jgi:hypothetical protein